MNNRSLERHRKNRQRRKKEQQQRQQQRRNIIITVIGMSVIVFVIIWISSCTAKWAKKQHEDATASNTQPTFFSVAEKQNAIPDNGDDGYYVDNIFIWNNQAFECFDGNSKNALAYASLINHCSQRLPETVKNVYSMVIPTHIALGLPTRLENTIKSNNQKNYIAEIYRHYDKTVTSVAVFDTFDKHKKEYLFFNTDHRWTTLGSYYAYEQFCQYADLKVHNRQNRKYSQFQPFVGSLYAVTNLEMLKNNADTLRYYDIDHDYTVQIRKNNDSQWKTYDSIYNKNATTSGNAYDLFLYGDNSLTKIICEHAEKDSNLLVVKDSYANNFIPWIIGQYHEIHAIDFSTYEGNIPSYCRNNHIDSVLFLNDVMSSINPFQLENIGNMF